MEEEDINLNSSPGNVQKKTFRSITAVNKPEDRPFRELTKQYNNRSFYNTSLGDSKYDANIISDAEIDDFDIESSINEHRAQNQPAINKWAAGAVRTTTKALTEVAKLPGVVGGLIAAPFVKDGEGFDMAFNNAWIRTLDNVNEKINQDILPVYVKKAVSEGNLWDNISSVDFWATDGADGLGFIAAMMVPGAAFEYAGLGGKLIGAASKGAKYAGMIEKTETGVSALKAMGITGKTIDSSLAVMGNTIFEAGAEAKSVGDDIDAKKQDFIDSYLKAGYSSEEAEQAFKEQRALAMRDTFVSNVAILLGPNAIMHKAIWGKAGKTFVKESDSALKRLGKVGERWGTAFASEGFWGEGSQTTVENMYTKKALNSQLGKNNDFNIGDFTKEYVNTLTSVEGQKAIFLGGALGGPMMSYQGRKQDVQNRNHTNIVLDGIQERVDNFNNQFDEIYQKDQNGSYIYDDGKRVINPKKAAELAKSLNYSEQQSALFDLAVQSGNTEVVEQLKQEAIFNLITPAIYNGEMGLQALEQKLNEDSKFQEIIQEDKLSDEKNSTKTFVKETLETAKYLQKQNEKFQDFSKDIIELNDKRATQEQKEDFLNKLNLSYLNTKHQIRQQEKKLIQLEKKRDDLLEELNINPTVTTSQILENGRLIGDYKVKSPILTKVLDDINDTTDFINKSKKDIADIWKGEEIIDRSFKKFVDDDIQKQKELSPENVQKYQNVLDNIKSFNDRDSLIKYAVGLDDEFKSNPQVQDQINDQLQEIEYQEQLQKDLKRAIDLAEDKVKFTEDSQTGVKSKPEKTTSAVDKQINNELITVQTSDNPEVNEENEIIENNPLNVVTLDENTNPEYSDKNQGSARLISTYKDTGEPIPGLEKFVEYEKEPRDKTKDKVTFSLGDVESGSQNKETKQILDKLKKGNTLSQDEIKALENYLPIKVTLSNKEITSNDIEAKKADIERRRQKELDKTNLYEYDRKFKEFQTYGSTVKEAFDNLFEEVKNNPTDKKLSNLLDYINERLVPEDIQKDSGKNPLVQEYIDENQQSIEKASKSTKSTIGKINAKYDAELDALENNFVSSYLDAMSHPNPDIVARETLPLRKAIVNALIENNGSFEGIEGKVEKQFSGTLQLGEQGSNILDLDVFKNMSEKEKLNYFKKNTVYVSNKGEVRYTATDAVDNTTSLKSSNRGEVFLKIPMINGKMFYLKLNTSRLTQEKASAVLELIILKSNLLNGNEELTSDELQNYIISNGLQAIQKEFDFIKRNNDTIDQTLDRLINFIVYSQNTNAKTKLILGNDGTLVLGELLHKVNSDIDAWSGKLESYTYSNQTLNELNDYQKQAIIEYLKYKRHNILITKDNKATFNNDDYLKYLLGINSDYPILTTNAVVNEPTFQGYSNIYLNQSIKNTNAPKIITSEKTTVEKSTSDLLSRLDSMWGGDVTLEIKPEEKESQTFLNKEINNNKIITNKSEVNDIIEQFKNSDEIRQLEMLEQALFATGKTLDNLISDNIIQEFSNLIKELKENNKNSEIKKICGH